MKLLTIDQLKNVSGGTGTDNKTVTQDGYLRTTINIPPHDLAQTLDVYLDLQKAHM